MTYDERQKDTNNKRPVRVVSTAIFFAAIASTFTANAEDANDSASDSDASKLTEVLVTAQKREERLQDTPVPVSVIDTQALTDNNLLMLRDLTGNIPSLTVTPGQQNFQSVTIRGLSGGVYGLPTVGIVVDDVLISSVVSTIPDFDPGDIARIEVLRGPQGTLYGANSIGGLVKYVTTDPSPSGFSGSLQTGTSTVYNGAELGYNLRGSVNVPLGDTLAITASAFTRRDPGYIDDVATGQDGVNRAYSYGGRLSGLWSPSEIFSLKLSALYQHMDGVEPLVYVPTSGYPSTAGLGDLQQNEFHGGGEYNRVFQLYNATMKARLGGVDLVSITGYNISTALYSDDYTYLYGQSLQESLNLNYVPGGLVVGRSANKFFSEEIRASSHIGAHFDWVVGAFFSRDLNPAGGNWVLENAVTPVTAQNLANILVYVFPALSQIDEAAFLDLTYHFTDSFDVQVGGRESFDKSGTGDSIIIVPGSSPFLSSGTSGKVNAATYAFTPRYKISNDLMVYSRIASGYQPGGPNTAYGSSGVPQTYGASKTWTYEAGLKSSQLDDRLSIDTSIYYVKWTGLQLNLSAGGTSFIGNASAAKSEGVEFSVKAIPFSGATVSSWVAYDDAVLTEAIPASDPAIYGASGERLPTASRWSGNVSYEQEVPLSKHVSAFIGGAVNYVGDRFGSFTGGSGVPAPRQIYPGYANMYLHAGVHYSSWTANLFIDNLADRRAAVGGGIGDFPPFAYQYLTPRTIGLNVRKTF